MKAIFFYLLPILQFLLPFVFIGSAFPFSSVHIKMLHQNYTDMFHPDSLKDSIKVLQIQNFASFVRKQWSNLHLFLQKKKNEILSVFSVSIFHLFFALFCLTLLIYLTLSSSNINNLPLGTFSVAPTFLMHVYPYLVFLIVTQVMRSQPYIVLLCFLGAHGLVSLCFLKVSLIPPPIICEVACFSHTSSLSVFQM